LEDVLKLSTLSKTPYLDTESTGIYCTATLKIYHLSTAVLTWRRLTMELTDA